MTMYWDDIILDAKYAKDKSQKLATKRYDYDRYHRNGNVTNIYNIENSKA